MNKEKSNYNKMLASALAGTALGALIGVLFAPQIKRHAAGLYKRFIKTKNAKTKIGA